MKNGILLASTTGKLGASKTSSIQPSKQVRPKGLTMGALLLSLALFPAQGVGQLANSSWPDYGGGVGNTHCSSLLGPGENIHVAWTCEIPCTHGVTGVYYQPVISRNGTIVLSSSIWAAGGGCIVGVNSEGVIVWSKQENITSRWLAADAAGRIIYGRYADSSTGGRRIEAISETDGSSVWWSNLPDGGGDIETGPTVGPDGTVYLGHASQASYTDDAALYAFDSEGTKLWDTHASGYFDNPAIASDGTVVTGGRRLYAVWPDGSPRWTLATGRVYAPAIGQDDTIYVGTEDQRLFAVDMSGAEVWSVDGPGGPPGIGPDGTVYCGSWGTLYAVSSDGDVAWSYEYADPADISGSSKSEGPTIDAAGNVYLSTPMGEILCLDPQGNLCWNICIDPDADYPAPLSAPIIGAEVFSMSAAQVPTSFTPSSPSPPRWRCWPSRRAKRRWGAQPRGLVKPAGAAGPDGQSVWQGR